jgi:hypothetical protein
MLEDTERHGNTISSVNLGFFIRSREVVQGAVKERFEIFLVPMTTVRGSAFNIHGM